jgi:hypothetical protein
MDPMNSIWYFLEYQRQSSAPDSPAELSVLCPGSICYVRRGVFSLPNLSIVALFPKRFTITAPRIAVAPPRRAPGWPFTQPDPSDAERHSWNQVEETSGACGWNRFLVVSRSRSGSCGTQFCDLIFVFR